MHDVLRNRLLRKIESLPEEQIYQVLDYIEFLESKYSGDIAAEASGLQRFAEKLEDRMRRRTLSPANIREAFQLIAAADRVLSTVSNAGKQLLNELNSTPQGDPGGGARDQGGPSLSEPGGQGSSREGTAPGTRDPAGAREEES